MHKDLISRRLDALSLRVEKLEDRQRIAATDVAALVRSLADIRNHLDRLQQQVNSIQLPNI